jgi:DNA polymerase-1
MESSGAGHPDGRPRLAYFLHDEVIVHTPARHADEVAEAVVAAAREAGRLLFGEFPIEFGLDVAVVESYADAG